MSVLTGRCACNNARNLQSVFCRSDDRVPGLAGSVDIVSVGGEICVDLTVRRGGVGGGTIRK